MAGMKQVSLMIALVALVGCGKKEDGNTGVVNPNKPSPKAVPEKLITDPIVEEAIRKHLKKPTGELTEADLSKVAVVGVSYTELTDEGLKGIAKMQQLEILSLTYTQITDAGLKDIAKLQQLEILSLDETQITDAGLKEVAKLQKLQSLNLEGTKITDAGLKEIAKLQNLTHLFLGSTKITDAGVAELKKALPNCRIHR